MTSPIIGRVCCTIRSDFIEKLNFMVIGVANYTGLAESGG